MTARDSNFANAYEGTLTVEMGANDLTCVVDTTTGAPSSPCYLCIEPTVAARREYVYFDGTFTGTTLVTSDLANRYLSGSAAGSGITHPVGAKVRSVPAAQMFEDIHDRIDAALSATIFDAAGDLLYASAADTAARLAKGTARQQLAMNAGATAPEWVASLQSLLTAAGDIVYASGANTPARLAKGTDGDVLTLASGVPSWAAASSGTSFVGARAYRTTNQALTNGVYNAIQMTTESYDTDAIHDTGSNTDRFTVPVGLGGKWMFTGYAAIQTPTALAIVTLYKNGVDPGNGLRVQARDAGSGGTEQHLVVSDVFDLVAGDYISLIAYADNTGINCPHASLAAVKIG